MASWSFELLGRTGAVSAFLVPQSWSLTRRLNRASTLTMTVRADTTGADRITMGSLVRARRAGTNRFGGIVVPFSVSGDSEGVETVNVTAHDPYEGLARRVRASDVTYTSTDASSIAAALIADENAREDTHLQAGSLTTSVSRDRTYSRSKPVAEAIRQLSEVDDGFYFVIDPADNGSKVAEFTTRWPSPGVDRPAARFEYGADTIANLSSLSVDVAAPANQVLALGAGEGSEQLVSAKSDAGSIFARGMHEVSISHVDVTVQATLDEHALAELHPEPRKTFSVTAAMPDEGDGPHVPLLGPDFDVGDCVYLYSNAIHPDRAYDGLVCVTQATVGAGENGVERLTAMTLEAL